MRGFYRRIRTTAGRRDGDVVRRADGPGGQAGPRGVRGAREGPHGDGAGGGRRRARGRRHRHRAAGARLSEPAARGGRVPDRLDRSDGGLLPAHPERRPGVARVGAARCMMSAAMAVQNLYALQNGFMGAQRSLLFYGEFAEARTQIPITSYVVRTSDAVILYDTGVSPRAVPGLIRSDTLARFTEDDLLVHRL